MKIEMCESLLYSWLRHVKECKIVQTNWKVSGKWELKNADEIAELMKKSNQFFESKYGYSVYKNNSLEQLLMQAEVDVLGISVSDGNEIYAIDVAFHESGLNYGAKNETVSRVVKKIIRTAMCIYGYLDTKSAEIIFATPKINPAIIAELSPKIDDINALFEYLELKFKARLIANEEFQTKILDPILLACEGVSDTSELFLRSYQLVKMFTNERTVRKAVTNCIVKEDIIQTDTLSELKVGKIANTILREALINGLASDDEVLLMQGKDYSKQTFGIDYPLLVSADSKPIKHYYANTLTINNKKYCLCIEWFEGLANNDRPLLIKWLEEHDALKSKEA